MAHFVCSDLHGQYWAWEKIKGLLNENDNLIFLGDAIDRGPDGIRIAMEILARPNTTYIMGNHEDMMIDYMLYHGWDYNCKKIWYYNGGEATHKALKSLDAETRNNFLKQIADLPLEATYEREDGIVFSFTHAGYTPSKKCEPDRDQVIWDRKHYLDDDKWDEKEFPNFVIIHGHTPIQYIVEDRNNIKHFCDTFNNDEVVPDGAFYYCNGHKIDVDCGVHYTGYTTLLNVDTMKETIITKD